MKSLAIVSALLVSSPTLAAGPGWYKSQGYPPDMAYQLADRDARAMLGDIAAYAIPRIAEQFFRNFPGPYTYYFPPARRYWRPGYNPPPQYAIPPGEDPNLLPQQYPGVTKSEIEQAMIIYCQEHTEAEICMKLRSLTEKGRK